MKLLYTFLATGFILLSAIPLTAQRPNLEWQKALGGTSNDEAKKILITADGGVLVAGQSASNDGDVSAAKGNTDYWVVKLDASGNLVWEKSYGGTGDELLYDMQATDDGGYIFAGSSFSTDGDITNPKGGLDYWIVKTDADGVLDWQVSLGGTAEDQAKAIRQTSDGGYIVVGESNSLDGDVSAPKGNYDIWVVKLDGAGNIDWEKSYGGTDFDVPADVLITEDNGYLIAGKTVSSNGDVTSNHGNTDCWLFKTDDAGTLSWQVSLGGTGFDESRALSKLPGGGYQLLAYSQSLDGNLTYNHGAGDFWLVQTDNTGSLNRQRVFGGSLNDDPAAMVSFDNGFALVGAVGSNDFHVKGNHGNSDVWVMKTGNAGNFLWQKAFGGSNSDVATAIMQSGNSNLFIAGNTQSNDGDVSGNHGSSDFWVLKLGFGCGKIDTSYVSHLTPTTTAVTWDPVPGATRYQIRYKLNTSDTWSSTIFTKLPYNTLYNLQPNTTYRRQIRAYCSNGWAPWSDPKAFYTGVVVDTCTAPKGTRNVVIDSATVRVFWNRVGGSDFYQIRYKEISAITWNTNYTSKTYRTLDSLQPGTDYQYQVKALCPDGTSWTEYSFNGYFRTLDAGSQTIQAPPPGNLVEKSQPTRVETSIYPNPVDKTLYFSWGDERPTSLFLINSSGQVLRALRGDGIADSMDVSGLPTGMYFLQLIYPSGQMQSLKLLK